MTYTFNLSDGTTINIADGAIDTSQFSIPIVGRNTSGYGTSVAKALVLSLENFSSNAVAPTNSVRGQLWYDFSVGKLKVDDGSVHRSILTETATGVEFTVTMTAKANLLPDLDNTRDLGSAVLRFNEVFSASFKGALVVTGGDITFDGDNTRAVGANATRPATIYTYDLNIKDDILTATDNTSDIGTNAARIANMYTYNLDVKNTILPDTNNTRNIGSGGLVFANMYATLFNGTATAARYS